MLEAKEMERAAEEARNEGRYRSLRRREFDE
jgi:hypothetical protein